ncbi:hypothetical protein D9756_001935 [Leucocoprinus leucothites]|uniref:Uncharacterized protein n=1 Tax=Leucocoprinus leucothites TaxID=201217 RepID=A0A8H5G470_9AGAR|nr:hypothetical protein D9756_001935 [Leucoagaricus leucothites]
MSNESSILHSITRSKLYGSVSPKDQCSLHRWVLLKNSILSSSNLQDTTVSEYPEAISNPNEDSDEEGEVAEEEIGSVVDAFMFPDAGNFVSPRSTDTHDSEAQWLDSLLETLAEDEDDDYPSDSDPHSTLPADEDDDQLLSPTLSPLASSEDLHQPRFYSHSVSVPYSTCFSPFDSTHGYDFAPALNSPVPSLLTAFEDALPYHDLDDIEGSSVPDAIEDVSDDESDTLSTPSFGRSIASLFLDSNSTSTSPTERGRLRGSPTPSYDDKRPRYLNPFELDPLPFPDESSHHTFYSGY